MSKLTINTLIEAFSKLTPEERARPLLIDTSSFYVTLERTPDQISLFGLGEMAFTLSPTIKNPDNEIKGIQPKNLTTLLSFHVKSPDNPDYVILGKVDRSVMANWSKNCWKAGLELQKLPMYNQVTEED